MSNSRIFCGTCFGPRTQHTCASVAFFKRVNVEGGTSSSRARRGSNSTSPILSTNRSRISPTKVNPALKR
jgi:hypothetical protein